MSNYLIAGVKFFQDKTFLVQGASAYIYIDMRLHLALKIKTLVNQRTFFLDFLAFLSKKCCIFAPKFYVDKDKIGEVEEFV